MKIMKKVPRLEVPAEALIDTGPKYDLLPANDLILAERLDEDERTAGGIVIPDKARASMLPRFRVLAVGPGKLTVNGTRVPPQVTPGDMVALTVERGPCFDVPSRPRYTVLTAEDNILAILREQSELQ